MQQYSNNYIAEKKELKANHYKAWLSKVQRDYYENSSKHVPCIDEELTEKWFNNAPSSSLFEEEEINANYLSKKRGKSESNPTCRLWQT